MIENCAMVDTVKDILDDYDVSCNSVDGGLNVTTISGLQFVNIEILKELQNSTGYENCEITSVKSCDGYFIVDLY